MYCLRPIGWLFAALTMTIAAPAQAEKRVALVIGNSEYRHVSKLPNPSNDATAVSILLKKAGFDVVETRQNLGVSDMRRAVRDFSDIARDADMAAVFYAGHGIEVNGSNYLVPIDAVLERDIDVEDETVSLERILNVLESAKRLRLIILDACRDNPFAKTMKRTMASRAIGRGLARVEPVTSDTLIAFAAKAGSIAIDGRGIHSPFTAALLEHLAAPGLDLRIAFGRVRDEVLKITGNKQEPFVYGSLGGANVALIPTPREVSPVLQAPAIDTSTSRARIDYELAAQVGTREAWDSFLSVHSSGFYADLARAQRAKLSAIAPTESLPKSSGADPKIKEDAPKKSVSELACCLAYYRGERSLEGWAPPERCRRNMQNPATKGKFCTWLKQFYPSRYSGLAR